MAAPRLAQVPFEGFSDRRETSRFPVREEVRYRVLGAKSRSIRGRGMTVDMSSGGIAFTTEGELPFGRAIELSVNWPARLGGVCPLQLVAIGPLVRSYGAAAAIRIDRYEFKTRKVTD